MKIYVGNLPSSVCEEELRELFKEFGPVRDIKIKSGFAFVELDSGGNQAIDYLDGYDFQGRYLIINEARDSGRGREHGRNW